MKTRNRALMKTALRNLYILPVLIGGLGLIPAGAASFSFTGSMTTNRENHTATLLPNGTLLVAGGNANDGSAYLSSAELYNPGSGAWTATRRRWRTLATSTPRLC